MNPSEGAVPSRTRSRTPTVWLALLAGIATAAHAGRPLSVDDANTNDAGAGHVEAWVARAAGTNVVTVAPAYAPWPGVELAAALSRDDSTRLRTAAVQLKWRITPSRERGCNVGASFGGSREEDGGARAAFVNGLLTCNFGGEGSTHLNLGVVEPRGGSSATTWGVAYERELGAVTPHAEWFGQKGSKPTLQFGLRGEVLPSWQLDGTVGRSDGENLYSVGLKVQF